MKIEHIRIRNFRCFGPEWTTINLNSSVTVCVGGNGSGKTAAFQAMSRLFGVSRAERTVHRRDFHIPLDQEELQSDSELAVEALFSFPELKGPAQEGATDAVPEFFQQMTTSGPGSSLKVRVRLQATWIDDGTAEGTIEEDIRWIPTLDDEFEWDDCSRVQPAERGSIQVIYVPARRDAAAQVTALLKSRLWKAAKWSTEFQGATTTRASEIQEQFRKEKPTEIIGEHLAQRWRQLHEAETDATPILRLLERRFEEIVRKAEFAFAPDEQGQERSLDELSDGQRSLFHIALTAATLEVEKVVFAESDDESPFDLAKAKRTSLTILVIEEPENSLSPFYLSRIVAQARDIGLMPAAQVVMASHSPAILTRIDPTEVRYFRMDRATRQSDVLRLTLPQDDGDADKYVRLAVRAHPEIYFARFVILGEGASEHLVLSRLAEAMGIPLDSSFVPVVPLGGRYVTHFWRLLNDLRIPYATLLDLDLGRKHGGVRLIAEAIDNLDELDVDWTENAVVQAGDIQMDQQDAIQDGDLLEEGETNGWLQALRAEGVYFSFPLDIDFAMLRAFSETYQQSHPGGTGPRTGDGVVDEKKIIALKTGGSPQLYDANYDDAFTWYPYLFLGRSKPETHLAALAGLENEDLAESAPPELKELVKHAKREAGLEELDK